MILVDRIKLGLVRARAEYIRDYCYDKTIANVAIAIIHEVEEAEKAEDELWKRCMECREPLQLLDGKEICNCGYSASL